MQGEFNTYKEVIDKHVCLRKNYELVLMSNTVHKFINYHLKK